MLYMAGLYSIFTDQDGKKHAAYVILTVNANPSVSPIHDRMPLIVAPDLQNRWLQDEEYARLILSAPCLAEMTAARI